MFDFRSLVLGTLAACLIMLATRPVLELHVEREEPRVRVAMPPAATIVDVANGVSAMQVPELVKLAAGERVVAIDDRAVADDLDAGAKIVAAGVQAGGYVDLTVAGATGTRRVLVLFH